LTPGNISRGFWPSNEDTFTTKRELAEVPRVPTNPIDAAQPLVVAPAVQHAIALGAPRVIGGAGEKRRTPLGANSIASNATPADPIRCSLPTVSAIGPPTSGTARLRFST
jgi:hypothetical protein